MMQRYTFLIPITLGMMVVACVPMLASNPGTAPVIPQRNPVENLRLMRTMYTNNKEFPAWAIGFAANRSEYDACCKSVKIYTLQGSNKQEVLDLYTEREPCNITMTRHYHPNVLKQNFGWEHGYYATYYEKKKKLAPQTILCCKAPVIEKDKDSAEAYKSETFDPSNFIYANIINVIGAALDNEGQADYQYFLGQGFSYAKRKALYCFYINVFNMVFQYLCDHGAKKQGGIFTRVVLNQFGCVSFAGLYPGKGPALVREIFIPAFKHSLDRYAPQLKASGITEIAFTGGSGELGDEIPNIITGYDFETACYGYIPHMFYGNAKFADKAERDKTAFTNAWDNLSLLGNGNAGDPSLDGYWGRVCGFVGLGWTLTNPHMTQNIITEVDATTDAVLPPSSLPLVGTPDDPLTPPPTAAAKLCFFLALSLPVYFIWSLEQEVQDVVAYNADKEKQKDRYRVMSSSEEVVF